VPLRGISTADATTRPGTTVLAALAVAAGVDAFVDELPDGYDTF